MMHWRVCSRALPLTSSMQTVYRFSCGRAVPGHRCSCCMGILAPLRPGIGLLQRLCAQPAIPERVINADPEAWYRGDPAAMGQETMTSGERRSGTQTSFAACSRTIARGSPLTLVTNGLTAPPAASSSNRC